jgi:hypothetical protein
MSTTTMQEELTLALQLRDSLQAVKPKNHAIEMVDAIEPELVKLLYAQNKDLADLAYQKINLLLLQSLDPKNSALPKLQALLNDLHQCRDRYLPSVAKGFFGFWAEENWTGVNLALLALPLLMGAFFPIVGVGLLVYTGVVAASAAVDVARKSPDYWLEESSPVARELTPEQCQALHKQYGDIDFFLPDNNPQKDAFKSLDTQSYGLYTLVFGIAIVGLGSLLFPPIGISALALTVLSIIAVVATGMQGYVMLQKHNHILAEINQEASTASVETFIEHDSTAVITQKLPKSVTREPVTNAQVSSPSSSVRPMPQSTQETNNEEDDTEGDDGPHP